MALREYHSDMLELPGGTYIALYWPIKVVFGSLVPQGWTPPAYHQVKVVRGATERLWHVYAYERPTLDTEYVITTHSQHLTKWGAEHRAHRYLKDWTQHAR